jgi:hypothetical protein
MLCEDGHNRWWFGLVIGELHGALHLLHKKSTVSAQWENLAMISAMKGGPHRMATE